MRRVIVKLELSQAEAWALKMAAGNTMDFGDVAAAIFPNGSKRAAAVRGYQKLGEAWAKSIWDTQEALKR